MNRELIFKKMQGIGNDFVLIDSLNNMALFTNGRFNLKPDELAKIAQRNRGIGCDQILVIAPTSNPLADFDYLIYNQDGSCAKYCGNGARCVIRYLADTRHISAPITLNTNGRLSHGQLGGKDQVIVSMGQPNFDPKASGYTQETMADNNYSYLFGAERVNFGIVSMGNPHAVIQLVNLAQLGQTEHLGKIAGAIQSSRLFTHGVNISFFVVNAIGAIEMLTYERGCGFTLACGSGACATASFAIAKHLCQPEVCVTMPGGSLHIYWNSIEEMQMTGDASYVFDGSMLL